MMWLIIFVLFAYQYKREVNYRAENISKQLSIINSRIIDAYENDIDLTPFMNFVAQYFDNSMFEEVMVSVYDKDGKLVYSIGQPILQDFSEAGHTAEFLEAERHGMGNDNRAKGGQMAYFMARKSNDGEIYVHTAMPYTVTLADALKAEPDFWVIVIVLAIVVTAIAYYSTSFLSRNVTLLRDFANSANDPSRVEELDEHKFPHDELGDISREIVKLYRDKNRAVEQSDREHKVALHAIEEQARIKRQLTNNINHELKTPVAMIKGYLDSVVSTPDMPDELRQRFLSKAQESTERLCSLLSDVSAITRLEDSVNNIPLTELNFHDLVFTIADEMKEAGMLGDMTFEFSIPLTCKVKANNNLLTGVVTNLIKNAVAHSRGTLIGLNLVIQSDHYYTFSFYDNGIGVPEEHLSHLFERFYRIDAGRSRKAGGTGLGLSIVKSSIEAMGGTGAVQNRSTGGLHFLFTLEKWEEKGGKEC